LSAGQGGPWGRGPSPAYTTIEDTFAAAIRASVETRACALIDGVTKAVAQDDSTETHELVDKVTPAPAIAASKAQWTQNAVSAVISGASRHNPVRDTILTPSKKVPRAVGSAVKQLDNMPAHDAAKRIRTAAS
jgi:hypothetical protein